MWKWGKPSLKQSKRRNDKLDFSSCVTLLPKGRNVVLQMAPKTTTSASHSFARKEKPITSYLGHYTFKARPQKANKLRPRRFKEHNGEE